MGIYVRSARSYLKGIFTGLVSRPDLIRFSEMMIPRANSSACRVPYGLEEPDEGVGYNSGPAIRFLRD